MIDNLELVQGDGVEWLRSQPLQSIDGVFTDPPWGSGPAIVGQDNWEGLIRDMTRAAAHVSRSGARLLVWMGINRIDRTIKAIYQDWVYSGAIAVRTIPPKSRGRWVLGPDLVLVYGLGGFARPTVRMAAGELTQISAGRPDTDHPCGRPIDQVRRILRDWFNPGDVIADPFGGSATTACAAADLGIRCTSIEVDPVMHKTAVDRVGFRTPELNLSRTE